jgi:mannose-1-phosphate guanylyltransferase
MITVIIAGGSGTRLWPLSTPEYPKHLLKLTDERTMVQQAYDRAAKLGDVYVVTEASHAEHVKEQLPELSEEAFFIEPGRRGTGQCLVLALDILSRIHDKDEPIAFMHSDHHVRDIEGFVRSFQLAGEVSKRQNEVTLIGIEPTMPATGFGYIERDGILETVGGVSRVQSFKEKPDFETAKQYLVSGKYLWNCGYFIGSYNVFMQEIEHCSPELQVSSRRLGAVKTYPSKEYEDVYLSLEPAIIDYALSERSKNLAVVSATFDWADVGSFKDLHEVVERDEKENYSYGQNIHALELENTYIRNEESKPIAVIGLDNVVVVNTPQGLLVARKDVSQRVGEIAKTL